MPDPASVFALPPAASSLSFGAIATIGVAASLALRAPPAAAEPVPGPPPPATAEPAPAPPTLAIRVPMHHPNGYSDPPPTNVAELRDRGPAALAELLATWHLLLARNEPVDPAWTGVIDAVAGQRYATWSELYWYTDLARAEQEARRLHRPILALRLLGDLREDLSCANSRLFRATLYANRGVSEFLRSHFVLYWSSERPVPKVTIDFGDGRKLQRTVTGNSVHYVLDADGHVLDVLPGLYAPQVFQRELTRSLALAARVRGASADERIRATVAYHTAAIAETERGWRASYGDLAMPRAPGLPTARELGLAQRAAISKRVIEVPLLRAIGAVAPGEVPDDTATWSAIGRRLLNLPAYRVAPHGPNIIPPPELLDEQSADLVGELMAPEDPLGDFESARRAVDITAAYARLVQHIIADTAQNELRLRPAIRRHIVDQEVTDFAQLNAWIYDAVFATPQRDLWLGLLGSPDFTGLPGDGVVMP